MLGPCQRPPEVNNGLGYQDTNNHFEKFVKKANGEVPVKCTAWMKRQELQGRAVMRSHIYTQLSQWGQKNKLTEINGL